MMLKTLQKSKSSNGIAFFKIGSGHPIIFIHGLGLRAECWFYQIEELKKNHTVYVIDIPGHGKSDLLKDKKVSLKKAKLKYHLSLMKTKKSRKKLTQSFARKIKAVFQKI